MRRTLTGLSLVLAVVLSVAAFAQTPAAPFAGAATQTPAVMPTRVGIMNVQAAIMGTNEGRKEFDTLAKKYEPKQAELQKLNLEVEDIKKQISTQGDKMNEETRAKLTKQLEEKQRDLQHNMESAQADFQSEQNELVNKLGSKLLQVIEKYASDNGFAVILDVSNPQTPVLWATKSADMTEAIVGTYNTLMPSAPSATVGATPARPAPARTTTPAATTSTAPKPVAPAAQKPATPAPPK